MTTSIDPPNGGWWATITAFITGAACAYNYNYYREQGQYNRSLRFHSRQKALTAGQLTPGQYVLEQAADKYSPQEIEQQLRSWGGKWNGVSFANTSNFEIVPILEEPGKKISTYKLVVRQSQKRLVRFGRRGGATTKDMTIEIETNASETDAVNPLTPNDNPKIICYLDHWSPPNPVYNIASNNQDEWDRSIFTVPDKPFIETPKGQITLTLVSAVGSVLIYTLVWKILDYVNCGKLFRRRNHPDDLASGSSQISEYTHNNERNEMAYGASKLDKQGDVEQCSVTQGAVDPTVKALMESDSLLKVLSAFYEKKIPKTIALSLLKRYHHQTEEEAFALLEERRPSVFWAP